MKKVLVIYALLIAGIIVWYYGVGKEKRILDESKDKALKVSKHSVAFNESMEKIMSSYGKLTDHFSAGDSSAVNKDAASLKTALDSLGMDELRKDPSIYETAVTIWNDSKTELGGLLSDSSFQEKRESLNLFSNELFTLLLTIRYDLSKLYWLECSSAFGEDTPGNWISESADSKNPYGKNGCTTLKKVINFMPADSTKKSPA